MHISASPDLYPPNPSLASVEDYVIALVIADWFGDSESAIRGVDHELHLGYIPAMLAAFSAGKCGVILGCPRPLRAVLRTFLSVRVAPSRYSPHFPALRSGQKKWRKPVGLRRLFLPSIIRISS